MKNYGPEPPICALETVGPLEKENKISLSNYVPKSVMLPSGFEPESLA